MRRREVIALIAGATAAWPLVARTETSRRVGLLFTPSRQAARAMGSVEAIIQGLKEHGWIEGKNMTFEYRFADGKQDTLSKLAAELVQSRVDAIVAEGTPAIQAAKDATQRSLSSGSVMIRWRVVSFRASAGQAGTSPASVFCRRTWPAGAFNC
jgi:putative ABC transport system substrate-binding protein